MKRRDGVEEREGRDGGEGWSGGKGKCISAMRIRVNITIFRAAQEW